MLYRGRGALLAGRIYGAIYNDMAGGAGARFYMAGALYLLNRGAGARFLKLHKKVLDTLYITRYNEDKLKACKV